MRRLEITPGFIAALCLLWLTDQQTLIAPLLAAVAAHEAGHLIVLRLLGARVLSLRLGFLDARIRTGPLGYRQEMLAALAGPAVSVAGCCLLRTRAPGFAAISLLLGLFNLLPLWPLDGGRALRAALALHGSLRLADIVCRWTGRMICAAGLLGALGCAWKYGAGLLPVLIWGMVFLRLEGCEGSCICDRSRVQYIEL